MYHNWIKITKTFYANESFNKFHFAKKKGKKRKKKKIETNNEEDAIKMHHN